MNYLEQQIASWGNYPRITSKILRLEKQRDYSALMGHHPLIGRGLGRSYGDAALNDLGYTVLMTHFNKLLRFDSESGILTAQAGVSLDDILKIFVPRGWFLPVTPGTKFVTIGGAIASNVHGKNHHQDGAIGQYVKQLKLLSADGEIITCSPGKNREIYLATLGSNGLTGIILEAAIQLKRIETAYINQLNIKAGNFFEAFEIFDTYDKSYQYSVAWIDCLASVKNLGRSIVMFGNHATSEDYSGNPQDKLSIHTDPRLNIPFQFSRLRSEYFID